MLRAVVNLVAVAAFPVQEAAAPTETLDKSNCKWIDIKQKFIESIKQQ